MTTEISSASKTNFTPLEGGCTCRLLRYRLLAPPLITHCCHCTWCQRETGSAFATNAWIEASMVEILPSTSSSSSSSSTPPQPLKLPTPTLSGKPQTIYRCPSCYVAIWSNYGGAGPLFNFIRAGTLDLPETCQPDVHIFTDSKVKWVKLPENGGMVDGKKVTVVGEYYRRSDVWTKEAVGRWEMARKLGELAKGVEKVKI